MNITSFFTNPVAIFGSLAILFAASVVFIIFFARSESRHSQLDELLKKETLEKEEAQKQEKNLQAEIEKLNNDLAVKTQMHDGLKGQYDELEKDFAKINQELENLKKNQPKEEVSPQPKPAEKTQAEKDSSGKPIIDLLRDLQALQKPPTNKI